jgi:hypothetical protein
MSFDWLAPLRTSGTRDFERALLHRGLLKA